VTRKSHIGPLTDIGKRYSEYTKLRNLARCVRRTCETGAFCGWSDQSIETVN